MYWAIVISWMWQQVAQRHRSASTKRLVEPIVGLSTANKQYFQSKHDANLWNKLFLNVTSAPSLSVFNRAAVGMEITMGIQHSYKQTAPFLRSHRPQLSWRRSPSCHCCRNTQASSGLEKARRETQSHLVTFGGGRPETSEHWSFFCVEKSFWASGLAPHRGHGYALEEYTIRRRMGNWVWDMYGDRNPIHGSISRHFCVVNHARIYPRNIAYCFCHVKHPYMITVMMMIN